MNWLYVARFVHFEVDRVNVDPVVFVKVILEYVVVLFEYFVA